MQGTQLPSARLRAVLLLVALPAFVGESTLAQDAPSSALPEGWQEAIEWRSIGPANMSGRITEIAVHPTDPTVWWAATAGAGLVRTVNGGTTFEHQFTHEAVGSVGALAVAPSDPDVLWLGTGEGNPRNSVSWGNGVYRSLDGGATWEHRGLAQSFQIGDVVVHPEDPNVVWVGVLGRLWGPSEERGLYRTTDGGESWERMLFVDDVTGVIDVEMHPNEPDTLLVATYERMRDEFCTNDPARKWGAGSGLWRTQDGGASWERIVQGLPSGTLGRIGLDWYEADPQVVWMVLESDRISQEPEDAAWAGLTTEDAQVGALVGEVSEDSPAARAGLRPGDIVLAVDGVTVHSSDDLLDELRSHLAGETVRVEISREREGLELDLTFERRPEAREDSEESGEGADEDEGPRTPFSAYLGGQRENVQRQQGPDGHEYGGVYRSADGGRSWERVNSLNPRPMYFSEIRVDPSDETYVYVLGVSLHRSSDGGKTFTGDGGSGGVHVDHHALWIDPRDGRHMILGNDGGVYETRDRMEHWEHHNKFAIGQYYHVTTDSQLDYRVYGGLQDNGTWGGPARGAGNGDWVRIGGGDGFVCRVDAEDPDQLYYESQNGGLGMRNLRTGDRAFLRPRAPRGETYTFNWRTPYLLSSFNSRIWYAAGNHVFRSLDRGRDARPISPDIARTERGSATALAESPRDPDELWVGTDDGALWSTHDGGATWTDHFADRVLEEPAAEPEEAPAPVAVAPRARTVALTASEPAAPAGDGWSGTWRGRVEGTSLTGGGADVTLVLERDAEGRPIGRLESEFGAGELRGVSLDEAGGALSFRVQGKDLELAFEGELSGERLSGEVRLAGGLVRARLEATRGGSAEVPPTGTGTASGQEAAGDPAPAEAATEPATEPAQEPAEEPARPGAPAPGTGRSEGGERGARGEQDAPPGSPLAELVPLPFRVAEIVCSRHVDDVVYVAFDGHRSDDDLPHLVVTRDGGSTWHRLSDGLPASAGSIRTVEEDRVNPDLLWVGTEFGVWISPDRGRTWEHANANLPTVAVHSLAQHPSLGDVVAGTHGRSLWILDATLLRQLSSEALSAPVTLFRPADAIQWSGGMEHGTDGMQGFEAEDAGRGVRVAYHLARKARRVQLVVEDAAGEEVVELDAGADAGLHHADWDLRLPPDEDARWRWRRPAPPGTYTVALTVDGDTFRRTFEVRRDPSEPDDAYLERELRSLEVELLHGEEEHGRGEHGAPAAATGR